MSKLNRNCFKLLIYIFLFSGTFNFLLKTEQCRKKERKRERYRKKEKKKKKKTLTAECLT